MAGRVIGALNIGNDVRAPASGSIFGFSEPAGGIMAKIAPVNNVVAKVVPPRSVVAIAVIVIKILLLTVNTDSEFQVTRVIVTPLLVRTAGVTHFGLSIRGIVIKGGCIILISRA